MFLFIENRQMQEEKLTINNQERKEKVQSRRDKQKLGHGGRKKMKGVQMMTKEKSGCLKKIGAENAENRRESRESVKQKERQDNDRRGGNVL